LELGKHIVTELELKDRGEILDRWLAHHVAELIHDAEHSTDPKARREAQKTATDTILKIWDRRANLPGHANPLARYREILEVLSELRPDPTDWFARMGRNKGGVIGNLYRRFPKLLKALLLLTLPQSERDVPETNRIVRKFLKDHENRLLSSLEIRLQFVGDTSSPKPEKSAKLPDDYGELKKVADKLISDTIADLKNLQSRGRGPQNRRGP
jgi:hypothetical protein